MTQKSKILELLKSQEWVSTVDAVSHYILRASERIRELEAEGYVIEHSIVKGKHYAKYHLISEPKSWDNERKEWLKFGVPQEPIKSSPSGLGNGTENASSATENLPKSSSPAPIIGQGILLPQDTTQKIAKPFVTDVILKLRTRNRVNIGNGR